MDPPNSPRSSSKLIAYVRRTHSDSVPVYSPTSEPRFEPCGECTTTIAPRVGQSASGTGAEQSECGC